MTHYDVFNGDADGICALHQLRLADPKESTLITGVKRDIDLLKQVKAKSGDTVTVLDISMDKNRTALESLLAQGIEVTYVDHHFAGDIPKETQLDALIDTDGNICTGLLVNQRLEGAHLPWAVTAAYGDNLYDAAKSAATPLNLDADSLKELETLGTLLNYNGYGASIDDLFFAPDDLYKKVKPYADPFDFIREDPAYTKLAEGFQSDMTRANETPAELQTNSCAMFIFPEESFSRRVSGVYSNQLARDNQERAHAILCRLPDDAFLISVRAPLATKEGADELCRQFDTGGGRKAAAGINRLPESELDRFTTAFQAQFGSE